jgi:CRP/FNR family transcriptional regulator, cyclic AMP receptor protein
MTAHFPPSPFNWVDKLPEARREILLAAFKTLTARQGGAAFRDGDAPPGIFRVLYGRADMYFEAPGGRSHFLNWHLPGESFGELPALDDRPHIANVSLEPQTVLAFLPIRDMHRLRREHPWLNEALIGAVASTFRMRHRAYRSRISHSPEDMILDRLSFLARKDREAQSCDLSLDVTQDMLASMVGLSLRRVSAALATLESKALIRREYRGVVLLAGDARPSCSETSSQ